MWLEDLWEVFQQQIFCLRSTSKENFALFNLYQGPDPLFDLPGADIFRRANLMGYLESFPQRPAALLLGEAPGWRGCRFTGVPFTDEVLLVSGKLPFSGVRTSSQPRAMRENSSQVFWRELLPFHPRFIAWNVLPLHPHYPNRALSNRSPGRKEIRLFLPHLREVIQILEPRQVVTVGARAFWAISQLELSSIPLRHPAHGGAAAFREGIKAVFPS